MAFERLNPESNLLESESEDGDLLVGDGVEQGLHDLPGEPGLLVIVHLDDALPVARSVDQVVPLTDVHLK